MLKETFHDDTHSDEWFQEDGATAHTAGELMDLLRRFPGIGVFPTVLSYSGLLDLLISLPLNFIYTDMSRRVFRFQFNPLKSTYFEAWWPVFATYL